MGPIGCPATSVRNYHYKLPSGPYDRSFQDVCWRSGECSVQSAACSLQSAVCSTSRVKKQSFKFSKPRHGALPLFSLCVPFRTKPFHPNSVVVSFRTLANPPTVPQKAQKLAALSTAFLLISDQTVYPKLTGVIVAHSSFLTQIQI
jgi:hypothetical protein